MRGIIDAVRNIVLDWALKLEGDGILGDEISFSDKEKQKAANVHYTIKNFISNVSHSQIQQGTFTSHQQVEITTENRSLLQDFLSDLESKLKDLSLDQDEQRRIIAESAILKKQLSLPKPKGSIIRSCLASVRSIVEGAAGSAIGALLLQKLLSLGFL